MQIGRFTMELGSGRLIAQEAYRDVTRTFTGAKVRWPRIGSGAFTAFAVLPVATLPDGRDGLLHNRIELDAQYLNQKFWVRSTNGKASGSVTAERRIFTRSASMMTRESARRAIKLWTAGLRLFRPATVGAWDVDVESAWQRGRANASSTAADRRALDVSSRLLHLHAGHTFARNWSPRLGSRDYGSGDADPLTANGIDSTDYLGTAAWSSPPRAFTAHSDARISTRLVFVSRSHPVRAPMPSRCTACAAGRRRRCLCKHRHARSDRSVRPRWRSANRCAVPHLDQPGVVRLESARRTPSPVVYAPRRMRLVKATPPSSTAM